MMDTKNIAKILSTSVLALMIVGCSSWKTDDDDEYYGNQAYSTPQQYEGSVNQGPYGGTTSSYGTDGSSVQTAGFWEDSNISGSSFQSTESVHTRNVFYFDFNKSVIKNSEYDALQYHAEFLMMNPDKKIHIIGHADERGTPEYNLALGERRAKSVSEVLMLQGVSKDQLIITSYGEESPAALGHDEASWSQNRRAELVY